MTTPDELFELAERARDADAVYCERLRVCTSASCLSGGSTAFYQAFLAEQRKQPGARWLDLGCAYGYLVAEANAGGFAAVGVDVSAYALARARAEAPAARPFRGR